MARYNEIGRRRGRKAIVAAAAAFMFLFGAIQVAPAPARSNPPTRPGTSIHDAVRVSPEAAGILGRACMNCHSNETQWPWYSKVAPASWLVGRDVQDARRRMNFSEWPAGRKPNAIALLAASCLAVQQGIMPPASYTLLHPEARLTDEDKEVLCGWTRSAIAEVVGKRTIEAAAAQPEHQDSE